MIPADTVRRVLAELLSRGGDFAEIYAESVRGVGLSWENRTLDEAAAGREGGAGLRLVRGEETLFASGNDLSPESLLRLASGLASALPHGLPPREVPAVEPAAARPVSIVEIEPASVGMDAKVALLERADRAARAFDPRVAQVSARYRDSERRVLVANSDGLFSTDRNVYTTLLVSVVAKEGDLVRTALKVASGTCGFELTEQTPPEELGRDAARMACLQLGAAPAPAGTFTVVLSSKAGGTMVHEACGHGLEADLVNKGASVFAGRVGEQVASPLVTLVDDGTMGGEWGCFAVDDEGRPAQRNVLIQDGVLVDYMWDGLRARKEGRPSSGNGRRQSYQHLPMVRMTNTYLLGGTSEPDEIVADTPSGVYIAHLGGGQVNTATGDFVFGMTEAYLIEDGRITEPLREGNLIGNGPAVLSAIDAVGNDFAMGAPGTCGKDGQGVPVGDGVPTLRAHGLTIGGTAA